MSDLKEWMKQWKEGMADLDRPCRVLNYCPYGPLVEEMPFSDPDRACTIFGHDCPIYTCAEPFVDR